MLKNVTIYHNPKCTKSRQTLELIRAKGFEPTVIEYLKTPPTVAEVERLIDQLGMEPAALLRTKEEPYASLKLTPQATRAQVAAAIAKHPILLERPVVVVGARAAIGRPPEAVLALL